MNPPQPNPGFETSGFFALRTPLLPFDELRTWAEGLEAPTAVGDPARLELAHAADRARLRQRLRVAVERPEVRDALFVASPDLHGRLDVWFREPDSESGQKVERSLVRYFQRMAGRATPFGLFAGCSVGSVGLETRMEVVGREAYRRHTRLDMEYLVALAEALEREPAVRESLTYRPNSTLYSAGGRLRYVEYRRDGKARSHRVVGVEDGEPLRLVLARAANGATPAELVAALLESDSEAPAADAEEFVRELIDSQLLVSDLAPAVTGPEPIHGLTERLRRHGAAPAADCLEQSGAALGAIDDQGPGAPAESYRVVARLLGELPAKVEPGRLFQVDMTKPAAAVTLGAAAVAEARRGVELLRRLAPPAAEDDLARFRNAFIDRYQGEDASEQNARWVPLVEALDEEVGIGLGTVGGRGAQGAGLLEGLPFPADPNKTVAWGKREIFLLRKLGEALSRNEAEIVLGPRDLDELANPEPPPLPDAFAVMATLAARSGADVARGEFRLHVEGVFGPSGASLLGRFCHADPALQVHVEAHLRAEEALHPDAIFAEVAHLPPEDRIGNILLRPVLRGHEIPYAGNSGVPADRQVPVSDLMVAVVGKQVVLRSRRLGRRVIPRLTSAHNFAGRGQGVYRFLCLLQAQGIGRLGWDWGPLRDAPFLPRVVAGRLVLACARWVVTRDELKTVAAARRAERFLAIQAWRGERRLPRWVSVADGDNELPVDLDNVLSVETFVELAKGRDQVTLVEMFPGPDELCASGPEGRFVHELVVPFVRGAGVAREGGAPAEPRVSGSAGDSPSRSVRRSFPPGSEWLYAKLYTGPATADEVLRDVVRPVVGEALASGAADGWFFIRYGDPEWHLRLRFRGDPARLRGEVGPMLEEAVAPFTGDGRVWRVQFDTYEREVERYGGPEGMELAERLFCADSEAVVALAGHLAEDARGELRWRLALVGMDRLLNDLGFDLDAKRMLLGRLREGFAREHRADANLKTQHGDKFRKEGKALEALLALHGCPDEALAPGLAALRRRSDALLPIAAALRSAGLPLERLAPSYLHMHANRMLRSSQRAQEMVLYDFLHRIYESRAARARARVQATAAPVAVGAC